MVDLEALKYSSSW